MPKALNEMTTEEMAGVCAEYAEPPHKDVLEKEAMTSGFVALFGQARELLLRSIVAPEASLAAEAREKLREELRETDAIFDQHCRGLYHLLSALSHAYPDRAATFDHALELIFGGSLMVVRSSLANESGFAERVRLDVAGDTEVQETLKFRIGDDTLSRWLEPIVEMGERMAAVSAKLSLDEKRREALGNEVEARNRFMYIVGTLRRVLPLTSFSEQQQRELLSPVDKVLA